MKFNLDTLRGDLFGGVTSMIVALPIALAFGVAQPANLTSFRREGAEMPR